VALNGTSRSPSRTVLFICGSLNQTTQMQAIARNMPDARCVFAPYYTDGLLELLRRLHLLEFSIAGHKLRERCLGHLRREGLRIDLDGRAHAYDLVLTCSDLVVQGNLRGRRLVLVQEGILDPPGLALHLCRRLRALPRWLAGTATTGLSLRYERFCVASDGYREHFAALGVPREKLVVTGIPNFDDCARYHENSFPHRGYVLACTSDARETFKRDRRGEFIDSVQRIAAGRALIFKLHPNENVARATREIQGRLPAALVFASGSAEEMVANCDVLVTQFSSTAFVGLALGKEVHSYFDVDELRRLLPVQNASAARNIAAVCQGLLDAPAPLAAPARLPALPEGLVS
jgi:hypothetical protein